MMRVLKKFFLFNSSKSGFVSIILCALVPLIIMAVKYILYNSTLSQIKTDTQEIRNSFIAKHIARELTKHYNPGMSLSDQREYIYAIAAVKFNEAIEFNTLAKAAGSTNDGKTYFAENLEPIAVNENDQKITFKKYTIQAKESTEGYGKRGIYSSFYQYFTKNIIKPVTNMEDIGDIDIEYGYCPNDNNRRQGYASIDLLRANNTLGEISNAENLEITEADQKKEISYVTLTKEEPERLDLSVKDGHLQVKVNADATTPCIADLQLQELNADIVLAIPTNAAACNKENQTVLDDKSIGAPSTATEESEETPIRIIAKGYKKFLKDNFFRTKGVTVGLVPYSGKISVSEDWKKYTKSIPPFNATQAPEFIKGIDLYGVNNKNNATESFLKNKNDDYIKDDLVIPIMHKKLMKANPTLEDFTTFACDTSNEQFYQMPRWTCYAADANMLLMQMEVKYKDKNASNPDPAQYPFVSNPYSVIGLTPDVVKVYRALSCIYPIAYDNNGYTNDNADYELNLSNFNFLALYFSACLLEDSMYTENIDIFPKRSDDRKKIVIMVINKPDMFEPNELTYLGFNNDSEDFPKYESDKIDFNIKFSDVSSTSDKHFVNGKPYDGTYTGPKQILRCTAIDGSSPENILTSGNGKVRLKFPVKANLLVKVKKTKGASITYSKGISEIDRSDFIASAAIGQGKYVALSDFGKVYTRPIRGSNFNAIESNLYTMLKHRNILYDGEKFIVISVYTGMQLEAFGYVGTLFENRIEVGVTSLLGHSYSAVKCAIYENGKFYLATSDMRGVWGICTMQRSGDNLTHVEEIKNISFSPAGLCYFNGVFVATEWNSKNIYIISDDGKSTKCTGVSPDKLLLWYGITKYKNNLIAIYQDSENEYKLAKGVLSGDTINWEEIPGGSLYSGYERLSQEVDGKILASGISGVAIINLAALIDNQYSNVTFSNITEKGGESSDAYAKPEKYDLQTDITGYYISNTQIGDVKDGDDYYVDIDLESAQLESAEITNLPIVKISPEVSVEGSEDVITITTNCKAQIEVDLSRKELTSIVEITDGDDSPIKDSNGAPQGHFEITGNKIINIVPSPIESMKTYDLYRAMLWSCGFVFLDLANFFQKQKDTYLNKEAEGFYLDENAECVIDPSKKIMYTMAKVACLDLFRKCVLSVDINAKDIDHIVTSSQKLSNIFKNTSKFSGIFDLATSINIDGEDKPGWKMVSDNIENVVSVIGQPELVSQEKIDETLTNYVWNDLSNTVSAIYWISRCLDGAGPTFDKSNVLTAQECMNLVDTNIGGDLKAAYDIVNVAGTDEEIYQNWKNIGPTWSGFTTGKSQMDLFTQSILYSGGTDKNAGENYLTMACDAAAYESIYDYEQFVNTVPTDDEYAKLKENIKDIVGNFKKVIGYGEDHGCNDHLDLKGLHEFVEALSVVADKIDKGDYESTAEFNELIEIQSLKEKYKTLKEATTERNYPDKDYYNKYIAVLDKVMDALTKDSWIEYEFFRSVYYAMGLSALRLGQWAREICNDNSSEVIDNYWTEGGKTFLKDCLTDSTKEKRLRYFVLEQTSLATAIAMMSYDTGGIIDGCSSCVRQLQACAEKISADNELYNIHAYFCFKFAGEVTLQGSGRQYALHDILNATGFALYSLKLILDTKLKTATTEARQKNANEAWFQSETIAFHVQNCLDKLIDDKKKEINSFNEFKLEEMCHNSKAGTEEFSIDTVGDICKPTKFLCAWMLYNDGRVGEADDRIMQFINFTYEDVDGLPRNVLDSVMLLTTQVLFYEACADYQDNWRIWADEKDGYIDTIKTNYQEIANKYSLDIDNNLKEFGEKINANMDVDAFEKVEHFPKYKPYKDAVYQKDKSKKLYEAILDEFKNAKEGKKRFYSIVLAYLGFAECFRVKKINNEEVGNDFSAKNDGPKAIKFAYYLVEKACVIVANGILANMSIVPGGMLVENHAEAVCDASKCVVNAVDVALKDAIEIEKVINEVDKAAQGMSSDAQGPSVNKIIKSALKVVNAVNEMIKAVNYTEIDEKKTSAFDASKFAAGAAKDINFALLNNLKKDETFHKSLCEKLKIVILDCKSYAGCEEVCTSDTFVEPKKTHTICLYNDEKMQQACCAYRAYKFAEDSKIYAEKYFNQGGIGDEKGLIEADSWCNKAANRLLCRNDKSDSSDDKDDSNVICKLSEIAQSMCIDWANGDASWEKDIHYTRRVDSPSMKNPNILFYGSDIVTNMMKVVYNDDACIVVREFKAPDGGNAALPVELTEFLKKAYNACGTVDAGNQTIANIAKIKEWINDCKNFIDTFKENSYAFPEKARFNKYRKICEDSLGKILLYRPLTKYEVARAVYWGIGFAALCASKTLETTMGTDIKIKPAFYGVDNIRKLSIMCSDCFLKGIFCAARKYAGNEDAVNLKKAMNIMHDIYGNNLSVKPDSDKYKTVFSNIANGANCIIGSIDMYNSDIFAPCGNLLNAINYGYECCVNFHDAKAGNILTAVGLAKTNATNWSNNGNVDLAKTKYGYISNNIANSAAESVGKLYSTYSKLADKRSSEALLTLYRAGGICGLNNELAIPYVFFAVKANLDNSLNGILQKIQAILGNVNAVVETCINKNNFKMFAPNTAGKMSQLFTEINALCSNNDVYKFYANISGINGDSNIVITPTPQKPFEHYDDLLKMMDKIAAISIKADAINATEEQVKEYVTAANTYIEKVENGLSKDDETKLKFNVNALCTKYSFWLKLFENIGSDYYQYPILNKNTLIKCSINDARIVSISKNIGEGSVPTNISNAGTIELPHGIITMNIQSGMAKTEITYKTSNGGEGYDDINYMQTKDPTPYTISPETHQYVQTKVDANGIPRYTITLNIKGCSAFPNDKERVRFTEKRENYCIIGMKTLKDLLPTDGVQGIDWSTKDPETKEDQLNAKIIFNGNNWNNQLYHYLNKNICVPKVANTKHDVTMLIRVNDAGMDAETITLGSGAAIENVPLSGVVRVTSRALGLVGAFTEIIPSKDGDLAEIIYHHVARNINHALQSVKSDPKIKNEEKLKDLFGKVRSKISCDKLYIINYTQNNTADMSYIKVLSNEYKEVGNKDDLDAALKDIAQDIKTQCNYTNYVIDIR